MKLRLAMLKIISPVSRWISSIHAPWTRKRISYAHLLSAYDFLKQKPGSVLLSYTKGELSGVFIPGKWKHAAIFGGLDREAMPYVIEAKTSGVTKTDLVSFFWNKDAVAIVEPVFCDTQKMHIAADLAHKYIGAPYDWFFTPADKSFYCSELIAVCYSDAVGHEVFGKRERLGVETILPDDYAKATKKWRIVWDSTRKKVDANIAGQSIPGYFSNP